MSDDIENDFDTDDFDVDGFDDNGFDDLGDQKGTLGDLWRNNSLVKIGVILAAFAFLVGGVILFGGKEDRLAVSNVSGRRNVTETPGSAEVTESYKQAIEEENTRRIEQALRESESAVPMPVEAPKGRLPPQFEEPEEEDPLERWRRMQEERIRQQQLQDSQGPIPDVEAKIDTRTPAINALAQVMSQQMEGVLGGQQLKGPILQNVASLSYLEALEEKERQKLEAALLARQLQEEEAGGPEDVQILLPAGTIEYAQLITEANTDAPGPILAQIATGPLAGARMIGNFSATDTYLTLNFSTVILDGVDYPVNGIAIDPETTLPGLITDIDHRYFKRIVLPMAAEFVTGLTDAIANSDTTTITVNSSDGSTTTTSTGNRDSEQEIATGIAEAGEALASIISAEAARTKPLLRVRAGTPLGVLFVEPVIDTPQLLLNQQKAKKQNGSTTSSPSSGGIRPISLSPNIKLK